MRIICAFSQPLLVYLQGTVTPQSRSASYSDSERTAPFRDLLLEALGERAPADIDELGGPQLRDHLLQLNPLDVDWIKRVNQVKLIATKKVCGLPRNGIIAIPTLVPEKQDPKIPCFA